MFGRFSKGHRRSTIALAVVLIPSWALPALALPVVPVILGPTGYAANPSWRGPALELIRASIRAELQADLAIVEQTYTVNNPGESVHLTMGLRYQAPAGTIDGVPRPLEARGFVDGVELSSENVRIQSMLPTDEMGAGWQLPIQCRLPAGESIVSIILAVPTVEVGLDERGTTRPLGSISELSLDGAYSAWGWTTKEDVAEPVFATALTLTPDVPLDSLQASTWMANAVRHESTIFWERAPNLTVGYQPHSDARRVRTLDGLRRAAQSSVLGSPRGHLDIPASAVRTEPPGRAMGQHSVDPARTRRAMLVPATVLLLLLFAAYLLRRRWEKRF